MQRSPLHRLLTPLLAIVLVATAASAQRPAGKMIPGAPPPAVMIDRLAQSADVIVTGRVRATQAEWVGDHARIQTRVTVAVDQTMKGAAGETITLLVPGGEIDGVGELYTHMATFRENEDVLVFASKDARGELRVTDGAQGKLLVQTDAKTGARSIPNLGSIDAVRTQITKAVKPAPAEPTKN